MIIKLAKTFIVVILLISIPVSRPSVSMARPNETTKPKNIIFMVGDGMGLGQIEIARLFEYGKTGKLFMETLPYVGLVHTFSANNSVTDSAAGGTALAIGKRTNNEMIGVSPDGKEIDSILDLCQRHGKKVGIVTTSMVTDATPAAFTASVKNRWNGQASIAKQQYKANIDVILGGGSSYFERTQQGSSLIQKFKEHNYTYVTTKNELEKANGEKLLGLFNPSYMNFLIDREEQKSKEPDLTQMTDKAIEFLSKGDQGFFVMVEGARIDQASHASDLPSIWRETIEFDRAVKHAVKWAEKNKDTLVIVVADHETMGISATEAMDIPSLKEIKVSPSYMATTLIKEQRTGKYTPESIRKMFQTYANIKVSSEDINKFNADLLRQNGEVYKKSRTAWKIGGMIAQNYHAGIVNADTQALSSTGGHTGNMVPIFAYGIGADSFIGVFNNVDVPKKLADLLGYQMNGDGKE